MMRDSSIQTSLDGLAHKLDELWKTEQDSQFRDWLAHLRKELLPYLHGRRRRDNRVVPWPEFRMCRAVFSLASSDRSVQVNAEIGDICPRTHRGFRIETKELNIDKIYDLDVGLNEVVTDQSRCRTVVADSTLQSGVAAFDRVRVEIPYSSRGGTKQLSLGCCIVRAWPLAHGSGWALLAPYWVGVPDDWIVYVDQLPSA